MISLEETGYFGSFWISLCPTFEIQIVNNYLGVVSRKGTFFCVYYLFPRLAVWEKQGCTDRPAFGYIYIVLYLYVWILGSYVRWKTTPPISRCRGNVFTGPLPSNDRVIDSPSTLQEPYKKRRVE
jgi:hypothetical protein